MKSPPPDPNAGRTTPRGLARYACEFMEAALATDDKMGKKKGYEFIPPVPVLFLVGQSIELSLKAFLLSQGVSLRTLRYEYGHVLHKSLKRAKELGLARLIDLTDEELKAIELLDPLYASKQLQYIVTGSKTYPVFGPLSRASLRLIHAIGPSVGQETSALPNAL